MLNVNTLLAREPRLRAGRSEMVSSDNQEPTKRVSPPSALWRRIFQAFFHYLPTPFGARAAKDLVRAA
jgi:hypothetical protein